MNESGYHSKGSTGESIIICCIKSFISVMDRLNCVVCKDARALAVESKEIRLISFFSLVDRASREALRADQSAEHFSKQ